MRKIAADTHAHTIASGHAYSTIKEMAKAARDKGLAGMALTEHAPKMPGTCHRFYFENLKVIPRNMDGVELFFGAELNIMDEKGTLDLPDGLLKELDIVIASIHGPCYGKSRSREENTKAYLNVMQNPYVDIIGHPDDGRFPVCYEDLVKGAKESGKLLEVNNSSLRPNGFRENARENIREMLKYCEKYGACVTFGSDAHVDVDAGNFCYIEQIIDELQFPEELIATTSVEKLKTYLHHFR
ncbi:phosphatase [Lachnoclostridium sp. An181]|uniref:phosphatase n=1 Tax=Lachnoclostridium sp. An181 TaxID=1965575 RepID=UPI000B37DFAE|nr:phosphatase [Lachnoclostridium sp. An181]OUP49794.1 phosphatase [Lachnoclostridium sp. An181]